jgi:hypothetical protein
MSTSYKIALVAAAFLAATSIAQAANENEDNSGNGGYRELGPGGTVQQGVNPAFHPSMHKPGGDAAACERFFRTYDPTSGTYIGEDGKRHPC